MADLILTDEMRALLVAGAATRYGKLCLSRSEEKKRWPAIKRLIELGLAYDTPYGVHIRDEGRRAVGGPTDAELVEQGWLALSGGRAC